MKLKIILIVFYSLIITSCTSITYFSGQTPLDEIIVGYKRALVKASEKTVFEEFVKYKEMGNTFALYSISEINIDATTEVTSASSEKVNAAVKFPISGEIGASKEITMKDTQGGKINLKLKPIGNTPEAYIGIRQIFKDTPGLNRMYELAYYDNQGKVIPEGAYEKCKASVCCIPMDGLPNFNGNRGFAYIKDIKIFRGLIDRIREFNVKESSKDD